MNSRVIMFNYKIIAYAMIILTMIKVMKCTNTHSCAHVLVNKEIKSQKVFACAHIPYSGVIKCTSIDPLLINEIKAIEAIWFLSFGRWQCCSAIERSFSIYISRYFLP